MSHLVVVLAGNWLVLGHGQLMPKLVLILDTDLVLGKNLLQRFFHGPLPLPVGN